MTTPCDAIGLSERLRRATDPFWSHTCNEVMAEAATALDALQARVAELEVNLNGAVERSKMLLEAKTHWMDRATRAEQQRDEAYKRAAEVAEAGSRPFQANHSPNEIAAAIRRLAAGTEKEGK